MTSKSKKNYYTSKFKNICSIEISFKMANMKIQNESNLIIQFENNEICFTKIAYKQHLLLPLPKSSKKLSIIRTPFKKLTTLISSF